MRLISIKNASYIGNYKFSISFDNDENKIFDVCDLIKKDARYGKFEIFKPLQDEDFLKEFELDGWTLCWQNGADIAPELIYELSKTNQIGGEKNE